MFWSTNNTPPAGQRPPYSEAAQLPELTRDYMAEMYPRHLELVQAQVFFRHGERTPVEGRLAPGEQWPYCERANYLHSQFMQAVGRFVPLAEAMPVPTPAKIGAGDERYTRRTATLKSGVEYEPAQWSVRFQGKPTGDYMDLGNGAWDKRMCAMGQLTDIGLDTLHREGTFLRSLYIDKLGLLPPGAAAAREHLYVRTTDYSRVIQSTYSLLTGLYPQDKGGSGGGFGADFLAAFPMHTRAHAAETLHGNFGCYTFLRPFLDIRTKDARAGRKVIDDAYRQTIQVPSIGATAKEMMDRTSFASSLHPVFDELMSMTAHGKSLPEGVSREHLDLLGQAASYQWTHPLHSIEGMRLGFGRLLNDIVQNMAQAVSGDAALGAQRTGDKLLAPGGLREPTEVPNVPKLALFGCHDITVAPLAIAMGSPGINWLPFASMLTLELFRDPSVKGLPGAQDMPKTVDPALDTSGYFVRVRLDDTVLKLPSCKPQGKHHPKMGSDMCSLSAFFEHLAPVIPREEDYGAECGELSSLIRTVNEE
ncbi:hypothetical protein GGF46_003749 [Coemansia sp. RSA 552]|nr:hypothetical protein GGF46_003749 [Coemansia sp. RSA 552]